MTSSSSSLRRKRLGDITEQAEETTGAPTTQNAALPPKSTDRTEGASRVPTGNGPPYTTKQTTSSPLSTSVEARPETQKLFLPVNTSDSLADSIQSSLAQSNLSAMETPTDNQRIDKSLPATPQPTPPHTREGGKLETPLEKPESAAQSARERTETDQQDVVPAPRASLAETERADDLSYLTSHLEVKPKQKRAPRPHVDPPGRPKTSGSSKQRVPSKLVANLPNTIQITNRSTANPSTQYRPESQQSSKSVPAKFGGQPTAGPPPPLPNSTNFHIAALYKAPPSLKSESSRPSVLPITPNATPEKLRLMKALQMRKRNMQMSNRSSSFSPDTTELAEADVSNRMSQSHKDRLKKVPNTVQRNEADGKETPTSSVHSPVSTSQPSEKPSSRSSFTENDNKPSTRTSISSETGSSVTPRAAGEAEQAEQLTNKTKDQTETRGDAQTQDGIDPDRTKKRLTALQISGNSAQSAHKSSKSRDEPRGPLQSIDANTRPSLEARQQSNASIGRQTRKRKGMPDPLHVMSSPDLSDASEDESFMDGLENAKLEEAKPISVARSPATPIFSRGTSYDRLKDLSRINTTPSHKTSDSLATTPDRPKTGSTRSISSNLPQWPPQSQGETPPVPLVKKGTLSHGISKRIKALEVFTSRESTGSPPQETSKRGLLSLGSIRSKRSSFLPNQHPPNASINTPPRDLADAESIIPTTVRGSETSAQPGRPWVQRAGSSTEILAPSQKGESISVTARIVRTDGQKRTPPQRDLAEPVQMSLYRSPLTVERERPDGYDSRPAIARDLSTQSMDTSKSSRDRSRFSFTSHRSESHPRLLHTSDSMVSRMSTGTSTNKRSTNALPREFSETSSVADDRSKDSRGSRLKKRMSILSLSSRRSLASAFSPNKATKGSSQQQQSVATIAEDHDESPRPSIAPSITTTTNDADPDLPHVVDVGDVNVQFPDTLLWKRRYVRIDDQGYVIFTPPAMGQKGLQSRGVSRKFHLTDFKTKPSLPDIERQEMAWSVRMELADGSCVQCACESREVQGRVLKGMFWSL